MDSISPHKRFLSRLSILLVLLGPVAACETMNNSREADGNYALARESGRKAKRLSPEDLMKGARWAGDSLTRAAERELREEGLPLDSFRIKRLPITAGLATGLGATVAVVPMARAASAVRVSRPTPETFSYVRPAGPGRVWRAYFTRRGVADFYMQQSRAITRADK